MAKNKYTMKVKGKNSASDEGYIVPDTISFDYVDKEAIDDMESSYLDDFQLVRALLWVMDGLIDKGDKIIIKKVKGD